MTRILLTSVCRPFGGRGEGDSVGAELFHAQVTRAQGIFSLRQVIRCWAIDYIAQNLESPSVVLHYPSEREFVRELKKHEYDCIGINFVVATFHKVRRMTRLIRRHAPGTEIVLGGYGTVLPDDILEGHGDHICREEGIGFMRRLLGEATDRPVSHPYAPIPSVRMYSYQQRGVVGHLTAGLGCPNGCDFCCTSHFFKRRYVPFLKSGRDIYEALRTMEGAAAERGEDLRGFILIDEDFFLYKRRAREFLECVREGGRPLSLMGFGSVRGLSQFTADEIAEMGFDTIWTAFEGRQAGYGKLEGHPLEELYRSLKSRGVAILSSMIIGFPYQDRAVVESEFEQLMQLGPSLTQILIYFAFPGTPFHAEVIAEDRYLEEYKSNPDLRRWDGFAMHFKHPSFEPAELEAVQKALYRSDFQTLGPSIVRLVSVWLEGFRNLRESGNPLLNARALRLRDCVEQAAPALVPAALMGPTSATRREARELLAEIRNGGGARSVRSRILCFGAVVLAGWTWLTRRLGVFQQPALLRVEYDGGLTRCARNVSRLQGGIHANPLAVLREDLARVPRDLTNRLWAMVRPKKSSFSARSITKGRDTAG